VSVHRPGVDPNPASSSCALTSALSATAASARARGGDAENSPCHGRQSASLSSARAFTDHGLGRRGVARNRTRVGGAPHRVPGCVRRGISTTACGLSYEFADWGAPAGSGTGPDAKQHVRPVMRIDVSDNALPSDFSRAMASGEGDSISSPTESSAAMRVRCSPASGTARDDPAGNARLVPIFGIWDHEFERWCAQIGRSGRSR